MRLAAILAISVALVAQAQPMPEPPDMPIDAAARKQVIDGALDAMDQAYVFPETAAKVRTTIREREAAGEYAKVESARELARKLTDDLQAVTRDKHVRVQYRRAMPPPGALAPGSPDFQRAVNYGFEKAERLEGNIGLLELRSFSADGPQMEATAAAAMTFLANTDALIIDLRRNGGGRPEMVALVSSYLFDARTHLNDLYWREGNRTDQFFTRTDVAGQRFGGTKPVFVLVSKRTFSGAEEFAYNLKALKRATIVGETSGGGANPGGPRKLGENFAIFVPTGRAINPITKTNWEGVGVEPDVVVPAEQALEKARELAGKAV